MGDEPSGAHLGSPEAAFSVLASETRLAVLLELATVTHEHGSGAGLTFSELRRRVGVEDSGRFNYHLEQLQEGFIEKDGEEYVARYPGLAVVSAVYAGTYGGSGLDEDDQTARLETNCPCGEPLTITYESGDDLVAFRCETHGLMTSFPVPPGAASDRSLEALGSVAIDRMLANMYLATRGVCPRCWGVIDVAYPVGPTTDELVGVEATAARVSCRRCLLRYELPLGSLVAAQPVVRAFYREHGLAPEEILFGNNATGREEVCTIVLDETDAPERAAVTIELDDDVLELALDDAAALLDHSRP